MLEALGCIPKYLSWNTDSNFTLCNASYLELLHRKSGYEVPCNQSINTLFHTNRYGSGRKLGRRIMAKVGRRDEELGGGGDERTQDLLVEIAMLEAQKVQVIEFVKERSSHLAEIVEQANSEFQQVADDTMKGMDEAGIKVSHLTPFFSFSPVKYDVLWEYNEPIKDQKQNSHALHQLEYRPS